MNDGYEELEENSSRQSVMEETSTGGQGPTSGCRAIEEAQLLGYLLQHDGLIKRVIE